MQKKSMKVQIKGDCYVVGDIHGETSVFTDVLSCYNINNCTLILLGDIGIWRYRDHKSYKKIDDYGKEHNVMIYAFRGNHDNPAFFRNFDERSPIVTRFWDKFTHFKVLPDLTRLEIDGKTGIVIGGGVSIDRCCRRSFQRNETYGGVYKSNDWWKDETVPETSAINEKFDFILSHTGPRPTKVGPLNESNCQFFKFDHDLKNQITTENQRLCEIHEQFQPTKWWFGHYHINDTFDFLQTRCYAVDILTLSPLQF
jgi:hypothetical protein